MTKADLIDEVSKLAELTRKDSEVIVETIFDSIVRSLRVGDKIEIRGFGSFRTRQRKPRVGRNPKDRRARGSSRQEDSVLQAQQRVERSGQHGRRPRSGAASTSCAPNSSTGIGSTDRTRQREGQDVLICPAEQSSAILFLAQSQQSLPKPRRPSPLTVRSLPAGGIFSARHSPD